MTNSTTTWIRPLHVAVTSDPTFDAGDLPGRWCSTSGQDQTVVALLGNTGGRYFIELGANAPIVGSNTRALERDHGWRGICIEPSPQLHAALLAKRKCEVIGAAVSDKERRVGLIDAGQASHLFDIDPRSRSRAATTTLTVRLSSILEYINAPARIDYFSLDVEGHEERVMASFPFEKHRISILTVERPSRTLEATLHSQHYEYVCNHGHYGDQLWVDALQPALLRRARRHAVSCSVGTDTIKQRRCEAIGNPEWQCGRGITYGSRHGGLVGARSVGDLAGGIKALARSAVARIGDAVDGAWNA